MSTLRTNTISNAAGSASVPVDTVISGSAKAWVNFNGTGTVAIQQAFNVSSITDNGTGDYTLNFTTALADANYAITSSATATVDGTNSGTGLQASTTDYVPGTKTTSAARIIVTRGVFPRTDNANISVAVFR